MTRHHHCRRSLFVIVLVHLILLAEVLSSDGTCRIPTIALSNGVEMPQLMLGTAHLRFADDIPSNPRFNGLLPEETFASLNHALQAGWRGIDTAFVYRSHRAIGQVLGYWFMQQKLHRSDIFLTTKVFHGSPSIATTDSCMQNMDKMTPEEAAQLTSKHIEESMNQVGVGYFDLILLHWPGEFHSQDTGNRARRIAVWRVLESYYQRGWARAIGVSNFSEIHLQQLLDDGAAITPHVNQIEASVYLQFNKIVKYCQEHDIVVQAYSPLGRGVTNALNDPVVLQIAKKYGRDAGQVSMRYLLQKGYSLTCLSSSPERLVSNQEIFYFTLDQDDMIKLDGLNRPDGTWGLPKPYDII
jgi:diketogulonate reductase-like aldo/keto reductase